MKNEYQWKSEFAEFIKIFLNEMLMIGFKYKTQGRLLERFDEYCYSNGYKGNKLSKELVEAFCYGIDYEKKSTRYTKERIMCNLSEFLRKQGLTAYDCPKISAPTKRSSFVPYIFSEEELKRIFSEIDRSPFSINSNRHLIDPVLFRLLLTRDVIVGFLNWLEESRKNSIATRNQRLAALHAFFRYVQRESPENLFELRKILEIPMKKKPNPLIPYLTANELKILLEQPDVRTIAGRKDLILLVILYDTGARVQELIDLKWKDVRLTSPAVITLHGKVIRQDRFR